MYDGSFKAGLFNSYAYGGLSGYIYNETTPLGCGNGAAGTVFWNALDILLIDNVNHISDKVTKMTSTLRNPTDYPQDNLVVELLMAAEGANLEITIPFGSKEVLFPFL